MPSGKIGHWAFSAISATLAGGTDAMHSELLWADLEIGAGGMNLFERACLHLPSLVVILAENQRRNALELAKQNLIWDAVEGSSNFTDAAGGSSNDKRGTPCGGKEDGKSVRWRRCPAYSGDDQCHGRMTWRISGWCRWNASTARKSASGATYRIFERICRHSTKFPKRSTTSGSSGCMSMTSRSTSCFSYWTNPLELSISPKSTSRMSAPIGDFTLGAAQRHVGPVR